MPSPINSITIIKKKVLKNKIIFSKFFMPTFFSYFLFGLMLRLYLFFYLFLSFLEKENKQIPFITKILNPSSNNELILLVTILKVSSLILMFVSTIYFLFYLFISFQREYILEEKELKIKSILGVLPQNLTLELTGEIIITIITTIILSIGSVNIIYTFIYHMFISSWLINYLIKPANVFFYYDLIYIIIALFELIFLVIHSYFKLKNKYYKYTW